MRLEDFVSHVKRYWGNKYQADSIANNLQSIAHAIKHYGVDTIGNIIRPAANLKNKNNHVELVFPYLPENTTVRVLINKTQINITFLKDNKKVDIFDLPLHLSTQQKIIDVLEQNISWAAGLISDKATELAEQKKLDTILTSIKKLDKKISDLSKIIKQLNVNKD